MIRFGTLWLCGLLQFIFVASFSNETMAEVSRWDGVEQGQARILSAGGLGSTVEGKYLAGIEISLLPNWKTYWRNPGSSGVPTTIDYAGSSNLAESEMKYPVPKISVDEFGTSLVYYDHVLIPILITPENPSAPVNIKAKITYGVCEVVCIPADASFNLSINPKDEVDEVADMVLRHALENVPRSPGPNDVLRLTEVKKIENEAGFPELLISADTHNDTEVPKLFAAGLADVYVQQPELVSYGNEKAIWNLPLKGIDKQNVNIQFTLVQGIKAVESNWDLVLVPDF